MIYDVLKVEDGYFLLEGISVLEDYLKIDSKLVGKIICSPSELPNISSKFGYLKIKIEGHHLLAGKKSVFFTVKLNLHNEERLFSQVKKRNLQAEEGSEPINDVIVILDHINDPHNLGAVVRSCAFFGVKEVIIPNRRSVRLTRSAVEVARGGFALTELISVTNLSRTIEKLKEFGYWAVCTDVDGESFERIPEDLGKILLIFGSEGDGVSRVVKNKCDFLAKIPGCHQTINSLNISVAAGIFLQKFTKKIKPSL